uniref:Aspartic peptidase DDI1-type domain-containing protein n=1 Tax=Nymphaea colorata TaxID=210225 RepID=A0A5K0XDL7_9MAGN
MYIEILVNGKPTMAMIDTDATHNFVSVVKARRLGLTLEWGELRMKAVNSEAKLIHGVARDVVVKIDSWSEKSNFFVVPMNDYQMILGMELLSAVNMVLMPHLRSVSIMDEKSPCIVPTKEVSKNSPGLVQEALALVLEEFAGTTPAKLLRWRPPRHKVGHAPIELKKLADRRRGSIEFRAGDQVLVKLYADQVGIFRMRDRARIRSWRTS